MIAFLWEYTGAPRAERGPGASSNVTELWFCKVQNKRRKCCCLVRKNDVISKKKSPKFQRFFRPKCKSSPIEIKLFKCDFDRFLTSRCHLDGPSLKLMGPLNSMGPRVIVPPAPLLVGRGSTSSHLSRYSCRYHVSSIGSLCLNEVVSSFNILPV